MEVGDELYRYGTSLKLLRRSGIRTKLRPSNYIAVCSLYQCFIFNSGSLHSLDQKKKRQIGREMLYVKIIHKGYQNPIFSQ